VLVIFYPYQTPMKNSEDMQKLVLTLGLHMTAEQFLAGCAFMIFVVIVIFYFIVDKIYHQTVRLETKIHNLHYDLTSVKVDVEATRYTVDEMNKKIRW
jgi:hypothetical protein